jgi:hypothetical protein
MASKMKETGVKSLIKLRKAKWASSKGARPEDLKEDDYQLVDIFVPLEILARLKEHNTELLSKIKMIFDYFAQDCRLYGFYDICPSKNPYLEHTMRELVDALREQTLNTRMSNFVIVRCGKDGSLSVLFRSFVERNLRKAYVEYDGSGSYVFDLAMCLLKIPNPANILLLIKRNAEERKLLGYLVTSMDAFLRQALTVQEEDPEYLQTVDEVLEELPLAEEQYCGEREPFTQAEQQEWNAEKEEPDHIDLEDIPFAEEVTEIGWQIGTDYFTFRLLDRVKRKIDILDESKGYKHGRIVNCYSLGEYMIQDVLLGPFPELYDVQWDSGEVERELLPSGIMKE